MSRRTEPMETYPSNTKTNPIPPLRPTQGRGAANPTASVPQGQTGRTAAQRNTGVPQRGQNARQSYKPPTRGRPVQNTGSQPWLRDYGRRGQSSGASGGTGSRGTTGTTGGNPFRNANTGAANLADMNEIMGVSSYTGDPEDVAQDFLRQNGVSSPEEYQKKFFAEQAEKRQQREARRKAQEERARQYSELYGDEEAAAEYMGLRGGYTGEVDDLVQAEWERNGVSDAAGYRKVAEYQWRNMVGGTVDTLRNSANDLSYRLQEGRAEQLAENDAVRDAANGKGNYEDLYRYYLAKYQEETKDFEPVKAVDWGEAYNAETARMADEEGFNDYVRRDGQLYRAVGAMVPALTVSAGANIAGAAFAAGGAYGSARAAAEVGKALSASLTFSSASGSAYEEAIANGMDPEKAMQLATAAGAIELGTEALSSGFGSFAGRKLGIGGAADGFLEGIVGKLTDDPYVRGALVSVSGMLGEGFEEFLSEWGGYAAQKLLGGYDTRTMGEVWKDSLESFRDGAFVAGLLNAATLLQCGVPPQTAIEVGIDEAMTQDNVSLRENIDGRKTASTVNATETANRISESLRQKLPQRDLERFSETFELSPAGEKLAEALAGMDAADAARLTEAVTDAVADAVKRGENYSSLEDFLTDESVERMTEAVIEEAAETLGLADADDIGSKEKRLGDSRVAALKDMAKESLTEQFRKDGALRDTAERARQKRGSEASDIFDDAGGRDTAAPSSEIKTLYKEFLEGKLESKDDPVTFPRGNDTIREETANRPYPEQQFGELPADDPATGGFRFTDNPEKPYEVAMSNRERRQIMRIARGLDRPIYAEDTPDNHFASNVRNTLPEEGFYDVALHGAETTAEFFGKTIDAYTLAQIIRERPDYRPGEPIRLLSCSTGATNTTGNCFAQILANELNTVVIAPNKVLFVNPDGSFYIGSEKEGKLIPFYSRRTE